MSTTHLILFAVDLVAVLVLVFAVYYRRHRRRDLVVAFLGGTVTSLTVQHLDLVNDSTLVDVRYRTDRQSPQDAVTERASTSTSTRTPRRAAPQEWAGAAR